MKDKGRYKFEMEVNAEDFAHLHDENWACNMDQRFLKTKEDVLWSIKDQRNENNRKYKKALAHGKSIIGEMYKEKHRMLAQLYDLCDDNPLLPMPELSGWSYYVECNSRGAALKLCHEYGITAIEEDGETRNKPQSIDTVYTVFKISPKYQNTNEFADRMGVDPVTVRQWIKRGKIHDAVKAGSEWRIPTLEVPVLELANKDGKYFWDDKLFDIQKEYAFLNDYRFARFCQDKEDKKRFHFHLHGGIKPEKEMLLSAKEKERIECVLISNPGVFNSDFEIRKDPL